MVGEGVIFFFSCCYFLYFGLLGKKSILRFLGTNRDHRFSILVGVESNQLTAQMIKLWTREVNQDKCGQQLVNHRAREGTWASRLLFTLFLLRRSLGDLLCQSFLSSLYSAGYSAGDKKSHYGCMYPKSLSVKHSPVLHFYPTVQKAIYLHKDIAGTQTGTQQLFFFTTFFFAPRLISLCPQFPFYPCLFTYISSPRG